MWWGERLVAFGPGTMGAMTLVAKTTSWRLPRPLVPVPSTVSDSPPAWPGTQREYTSAVSMKLPPASTYASSTASDAFWSVVHPNVLPPRHRAATRSPERPSFRISMTIPPGRRPRRSYDRDGPSHPQWVDLRVESGRFARCRTRARPHPRRGVDHDGSEPPRLPDPPRHATGGSHAPTAPDAARLQRGVSASPADRPPAHC